VSGKLPKLLWKVLHKTLEGYYKGTRKRVSAISVEETHRLIQRGERIILLDVREKEEISLGYIKGALFIPRNLLQEKAETLLLENEVGVLGVVPGQIGLFQATEAIKLILRRGTPLIGRFLIYNALQSDFRVFAIQKNPSCPLCNGEPKIERLPDHSSYQSECRLESNTH